jgi:hypothetical protein
MGMRYVLFRVFYMIRIKLGILKKDFPSNFSDFNTPTLKDWRLLDSNFFIKFEEVAISDYSEKEFEKLKESVEKIRNNEILFFGNQWIKILDWDTHPISNYVYPKVHFTEIDDFSSDIGDIKYVWEKARFTFIYTLINYEKQTGLSQAQFIFNEIEEFIDHNPINIGPQYKCSQEMSIRVFNWSFVLFFYRNDEHLTEPIFYKIIDAIYGHYHHIYKNINFSRIAVRNNHAITETLALYMIGKWFPFFPNGSKWSVKGKKWFEQEIEYQLYKDGSFLQYSHNYHRVVIQLLTWGILTVRKHGEAFSSIVMERASRSVEFLTLLSQSENGWLPNYGQNDGALFFPLSDQHFRDFRPQLQSLRTILNLPDSDRLYRDAEWYGLKQNELSNDKKTNKVVSKFDIGGQYIIKDQNTTTVINNPKYINRPAQSDQLHLDIHVAGHNVLFDPGTYKYNTDKKYIDFFFGTGGHNTIQIGEFNQMLKGGRFIWYNWIKQTQNDLIERDLDYLYTGSYFGYIEETNGIWVNRTVSKIKGKLIWVVEDILEGDIKGNVVKLHWNYLSRYEKFISLKTSDKNGELIDFKYKDGWNAVQYGMLEPFNQLEFGASGKYFKTEITIDENIINSPVLS